MKYRRKAQVIEAVQFDGTVEHAKRLGIPSNYSHATLKTEFAFLHKERRMVFVAEKGDWVQLLDGKPVDCMPDAEFKLRYVDAEAPADPSERFLDVSDDELVEEMKRRWSHIVIAAARADLKNKDEEDVCLWWRGGYLTAFGLLHRSVARLSHLMNKAGDAQQAQPTRRDVPREDDDE